MSSQASFVSVATAQSGDAVGDPYLMQVVGSRFEAVPNVVADGSIRGFRINDDGTVVVSDAQALAQLTAIANSVDGLEGFVDGLEGFTDGLEALIGSTNTALATLNGNVDGLEGYTDGLEALVATTNTHLTTLEGYTDGLEALIGSTNTALGAISGFVDGLEGFTDGLEGFTDGIEAKLDTIIANSALVPGLTVIATAYFDFASSNLPGNATNPLQLVASLASAVKKISVFDTGGAPMELMTGAAAAEVRKLMIGPGADTTLDVDLASTTRVSIRRLDSAAALAGGTIQVNFLG